MYKHSHSTAREQKSVYFSYTLASRWVVGLAMSSWVYMTGSCLINRNKMEICSKGPQPPMSCEPWAFSGNNAKKENRKNENGLRGSSQGTHAGFSGYLISSVKVHSLVILILFTCISSPELIHKNNTQKREENCQLHFNLWSGHH